MESLKLKLSTHMDSGLLYLVYQNQGQRPKSLGLTSLDRFYFPLMKNFYRTLFSRTVRITKLKPGAHMDSGLMYHVYQNQG